MGPRLREDDGLWGNGFVIRIGSSSFGCMKPAKPQIDALHNQI
jgi:hypothetical protein